MTQLIPERVGNRRSRAKGPVAVAVAGVLLVVLCGCFPRGTGAPLGQDRWLDYSGDHADVVRKCTGLVHSRDIPDLTASTWDGQQFAQIEVEQSGTNEHWFTVRGTVEFWTRDRPNPTFEWTCFASEWGSAGSITSYAIKG